MTSSLRGVRDEEGEVVSVDQLGGGTVEITARMPHLAASAKPGQFAQLRCGNGVIPLLRRPFSVAWTDGDLAAFVLAPVGVGTRLLSSVQPGDRLTALGPLGTGFSLVGAPRAVCVAGGLGCAPFPLLVRALRAAGADVTVVNGAATQSLLYPADRFRRGDDRVTVVAVTVDGSSGRKGLVTDTLAGICDAGAAVYACGPNSMLAALSGHAALTGARHLEASLEAPMGCGYGTCLGCALPVRDQTGEAGWALCCRQGPVFPFGSVDWAEMMRLPAAHVA